MSLDNTPGFCIQCKNGLDCPRTKLVDDYLCSRCQTTCQNCDFPVMRPLTNSIGLPIDKSHLLCVYCYNNKCSYTCEHFSSKMLWHDPTPTLRCEQCDKDFITTDCTSWEFGTKYYAMFSVVSGKPICEKCYKNAPHSEYCMTCKKRFLSRNKLFKHLVDTKHYF